MTTRTRYETGTTLSTLTIKKNKIVNIIDNKKKEVTLRLRQLLRYDYKNLVCINAFQVIYNPEILKLAYESIKSNPGNMVRGTDKKTLDGLSEQWFKKTSEDLQRESYRPIPARRIYIPKANGKKRPLGISSPRDKIVQQAMKMVMEEVLEPTFHTSAHGFRPHKGCHSALKTIRGWKGVAWFLEGDIKSFFDSIDHHTLEKLIKKHLHFKESRLTNLYWKMVRAGYIEWDTNRRKFVSTEMEMGVPLSFMLDRPVQVLHESRGNNKPPAL
jgi:retron-type reverse transcriptase